MSGRRPISPDEAEAYELPELRPSDDLDDIDRDKLLGRDQQDSTRARRSGRDEAEEPLLNGSEDGVREVPDQEVIGKGTKIEQLIADVRSLTLTAVIELDGCR